jgi:hypothetical protein
LEQCDYDLTYKILNPDTLKIFNRSLIRPETSTDTSVRAKLLGGEHPDVINSCDDDNSEHLTTLSLTPSPIVNHEDITGQLFLMDEHPDGRKFRACVVKTIYNHDFKLENNKDQIKFFLSVNEDTSEEIITYNQLLDYLAKDDNSNVVW